MKLVKIVLLGVLAVISGCHSLDTNWSTKGGYWPDQEIESRKPKALGLDAEKLESIDEFVRQSLPGTTSVLVMKSGYLAYERYFAGGPDDLRPVWSVTKTVMSILTGILLGDEWSESVDKPIAVFVPDTDPDWSTVAGAVTLRDVLTMRSGLPSDGGVGVFGKASIKAAFSLSKPEHRGAVFAYNGTNPNLVSLAMTTRFGQPAAKLAEEVLFQPLAIEKYYWEEHGGLSRGAYGLSLRSRDMAKLGYLYLRKGYWRDKSVVPAPWVEESTRVQVRAGETSIPGLAYGFFWWIEDFGGYHRFFTVGAGAQTIVVIPELEMVIVLTTNEITNDEKYFAIIEDYVIPAANLASVK